MIKDLAKFTKTFESFKRYLYNVVYNKDNRTFKNFPKLPEPIIIEKAIAFLEYLNIPLTDAFLYYNYNYPNVTFYTKLKNMIIKEFYRLENNIKCNYEAI